MTKEALANISAAALEAQRCLLYRDANTKGLANIKQKLEEPFEEFVAWKTEAGERAVLSSEAKDSVLKQLAFENATPTYQSLLKTIKNLEIFLTLYKAYTEVIPSYLQVVAITAVLQGQTTTQFLIIKENENLIIQA